MLVTLVRAPLFILLSSSYVASAINLDLDSPGASIPSLPPIRAGLTYAESIKSAASTIAYDMMTFYKGNQSGYTPGILPGPPPNPGTINGEYFWWEAGAMWGSLIDYWYYTATLPTMRLCSRVAFWALNAMSAAELKFPDPPPDQPQWLALAQAVFNIQALKIDGACGGGLRWQAYYSLTTGYTYKNSIANGCFFNLAARLALYTGNNTYSTYAENIWTWMQAVKFMDDKYNVYDGAQIANNCQGIDAVQYSYNSAVFTLGAATMYSYTNGSRVWKDRLDNILNATFRNFFPDDIAYEYACETPPIDCTVDMFSQKAYLARWLAATTKVAPYTYDLIMPKLKTSAAAAALQCSGQPNGRMCGLSWSKKDQWDKTSGVGQQMAALEVILANLIKDSRPPATSGTGGTSPGNPSAGTDKGVSAEPYIPPTTGDKAGAGVLSAAVLATFLGSLFWISL